MVDKPLEIIGDGPVEDIEIRADDAHVLEFRASIGRVANLTLRQVGRAARGRGRPAGTAGPRRLRHQQPGRAVRLHSRWRRPAAAPQQDP